MQLRKRILVTGGTGFLGSFLCEQPATPLEKGLSKTIAYFEEVLRRLQFRHDAGA